MVFEDHKCHCHKRFPVPGRREDIGSRKSCYVSESLNQLRHPIQLVDGLNELVDKLLPVDVYFGYERRAEREEVEPSILRVIFCQGAAMESA